MKKIKLFLVAAVLLGAASAFTVTGPDTVYYVKADGAWVLKSTVDHITGQCNTVTNKHCSDRKSVV